MPNRASLRAAALLMLLAPTAAMCGEGAAEADPPVVSAPPVSFADTAIGSESSASIEVRNPTSRPQRINYYLEASAASQSDEPVFAVTGCADELQPGHTCALEVSFRPTAPRTRFAATLVLVASHDRDAAYASVTDVPLRASSSPGSSSEFARAPE
jgi:hypothetical protein